MTESISLFVIMPYSIGKNRVKSSPNSIKIKVFLQTPYPIVETLGQAKAQVSAGEGFLNLPRQIQYLKLLKSKKIRDLFLSKPFVFFPMTVST